MLQIEYPRVEDKEEGACLLYNLLFFSELIIINIFLCFLLDLSMHMQACVYNYLKCTYMQTYIPKEIHYIYWAKFSFL